MHETTKLLKVFSWSLAVGCALGLIAARDVMAIPPWLVPFKPVDADPENMYPLSPDNGPWMIMATTFTGDSEETRAQATEQARQLVQELRKRYKLTAYTYQKQFDYSKGTDGRGVDRYGKPMKMRYQHADAALEIAVLVGDYPKVNDPEAQRVLKKIKAAEPDCLKPKDGKSTNQALASLRSMQKATQGADSDWKKHGPMGQAFVVTNPLLPSEYFAPKGIDKLVVDMNKGVEHSLLKCQGRYTVKVATFTGQTTLVNPKVQELLARGAVPKSHLEEAAVKAHTLAEALRAKPYCFDAYEFHDRYSSIVTVGSFDSYGTKGPDGKINLNPQVFTTMQTFAAEQKTGQTAPVPKHLPGLPKIPFDVQPIPVEVPSHSIASDYIRTE